LFQDGQYIPLTVTGQNAQHILAFARKWGDTTAIIAVPRLCARLFNDGASMLASKWQDTQIELPLEWNGMHYRNWLLSRPFLEVSQNDKALTIQGADLFAEFPCALLIGASEQCG
jgi:(1->4)-alpha-D-glucan 1-alpha-D-glucosylmutase